MLGCKECEKLTGGDCGMHPPQIYFSGVATAKPLTMSFTCEVCGGYGIEHNAYIHNLDQRLKALEAKGGT